MASPDSSAQDEWKLEEPVAAINESAAAIGTLIHSTLEAIVNSQVATISDARAKQSTTVLAPATKPSI